MKFCEHVILRLFIGLFFLSSQMISCAGKELVGKLDTSPPPYLQEFDFSTPERVRDQIKKMGDLKRIENQRKLVMFLIAYNNLSSGKSESQITLLPHSKTQITLASFCGATGKAMPQKNEVFQWVKGSPKIQLLKEVVGLYQKDQKIDVSEIQEIIWNLHNNTSYEEYPIRLKNILLRASPSAAIVLPSHLRSKIVDELTPKELGKAVNIVKGQYYSFTDFQNLAREIKSSSSIPENLRVSKVPTTGASASVVSNGYKSQEVTLFNPSNSPLSLKIDEYYLRPYREDVQPIILASVFPYATEIQKILEEYSLKMLGYIGSQYPTLNAKEKELVRSNPIESAIALYNANIAESNAERLFPNSGRNGDSDALRHYLWAGLLTRDLGEERAREFLRAHESSLGQASEEKEMDDFNNERGIQGAKKLLKDGNFDNDTLYQDGAEQVNSGKLKILNYENRKKNH